MGGDIQNQVYKMLISEGVIQSRIAQRLNISRQRVSVIVKKLIEKGYISGGILHRKQKGGVVTPVLSRTGTQGQQNHLMRLHGQVFSLKILNGSPKFTEMSKSPILEFEGHKVQLFPKKLIVHSFPGLEFMGLTAMEAYQHSVPYWRALFERLEKALNILIFKAGSEHIKQIKHHVAQENNEIAVYARRIHDRIAFKGPDGIGWLLSDFSKTIELECVHPAYAVRDMEAIQPFMDDLRTKCPGMTFTGFRDLIIEVLRPPQPAADLQPAETLKGKDIYFG